jgi:DNA-binding NarL/FixJ family response regulator
VEAIRDVNDGGSVIQPNLARKLLRVFHVREEGSEPVAGPAQPPPPPQPIPHVKGDLTAREIEILRLIAKGLSNNEAAKVLDLSRATVRTHLEHIYQKLEVTNRVEAVTEGIRKRLIAVE